MLGATRRAPPRLPGLTEHQRHDARRHTDTGAWTWEQATWLSTRRTWLTQDHVLRDAPTTWPRSAPRKVPPWMTSTAWWPPGGDRQSRVCAGLSLLLVLPAALVAWPGWGPPGAPWSCEVSAGATSPWDLLRAGACAWWLSCCSRHQSPWMLPRSTAKLHSVLHSVLHPFSGVTRYTHRYTCNGWV